MSTVVIRIGGTDVTSDVIFSSTEFGSQVNGQAGPARLQIRDLSHSYQFDAGQTLTLDIDGERKWGGWTIKVRPAHAFKVDDTTDAQTTERIWHIDGVDYNILFSKRFLINKANPTKPIPNYPAGTPDDEVVLDVVNLYLDLSGVSISTAGVTNVGSPNPDKAGNIGNPGDAWGTAMSLIARPTGAIFYISPAAILNYVDVDIADASVGLSDNPSVGQVGFRDMEILRNGTNLVNDAMVWGAGTGSVDGHVTFTRVQDAASIAAHGRWQYGEFTTALYTQNGVNNRANSIVYGSPQNKRGGKDDAISITCTVFDPSFVAGQKVAFESEVFSYSDIIPIRRMVIRFPTPTDPEFLLNLSHEIDAPWADYEFWFPKFNFDITFPPIVIPPIVLPPPDIPGGCTDDICGITDTFTRTLATGWGTSDAGTTYTYSLISNDPPGSGNAAWTDGQYGLLRWEFGAPNFVLPSTFPPNWTLSVRFKTGTFNYLGNDGYATFNYSNGERTIIVGIGSNAGFPQPHGYLSDDASNEVDVDFQPNTWYTLVWHYEIATGLMQIKVWADGDPDPGWLINAASGAGDNVGTELRIYGNPLGSAWSSSNPYIATWDNIDLDFLDRCSQFNFENFNLSQAEKAFTLSAVDFASVWGSNWDVTKSSSTAGTFGGVTNGAGYIRRTGSSGTGARDYTARRPVGSRPTFIDTDGGFDMTWRYRITAGSGSSATAEMIMAPGLGFPNALTVRASVLTGGSGFIRFNATDTAPFVSAIGVWNTVRWECQAGTISRAKVWADGSSEPDWMINLTTAAPGTPNSNIQWTLRLLTTVLSRLEVDALDFTYAGKPCYEGGPPPGEGSSGVPPSSCESFDAAGTVYTLTWAYSPNTTRVYIDGLLQRPNYDYSETDPLNGVVTLAVAAPTGSTVVICYETPQGGGGSTIPL